MSTAEDRLAVQDVLLRYAAGVDDRDMDMYRACFADDAEIAGFSPENINGADAWLDYVTSSLSKYGSTQHMLGPMLATIDGDTAQCRTDVQAWHEVLDSDGEVLILWATYFTRMQRLSGEWKIVYHELVRRGIRQN